MYAVIQSPTATVNNNSWSVIELMNDAYVAPAGYVVGQYRVMKEFKHLIVAKTLATELNKGE